jgi:hypothetical protein
MFPEVRVKPAQHLSHEIVADLEHPRRMPVIPFLYM